MCVEYNSLYEHLSPHSGRGSSEPRTVAYPHYTYAYEELEKVVRGFAKQLTTGNMPTTSNALVDRAVTYSRRWHSLREKQVCPITLFLDAIADHGPNDRIVHIDPRKEYLMLSTVFTGIKKNPYLHLEVLMPLLGLDEDFLDSFSLHDLVHQTEKILHTLASWKSRINNAQFSSMIDDWASEINEQQDKLKELLNEVVEEIGTTLNLYNHELNLKFSALVFVDRWLKSLRENKKNCSKKVLCWQIQLAITRLANLLSNVFNYYPHIQALNECIKTNETLSTDHQIFLIAGTEHVAAAQYGLECLGYTFDASLQHDEPELSLKPRHCTSILHNIFTEIERVV